MSLLNKILKKKEEEKEEVNKPGTVEKKKEKETAPKQKESDTKPASGVAKKAPFHDVIVKPVISEKAASAQTDGVYTFVVSKHANKHQVARAIVALYGVKPQDVRIMNMPGKTKQFRRVQGRRGSWKKALVTLPKGTTIAVHENV